MENKDVFVMANEKPVTTWCIEYIQDDEHRTTFYRCETLVEAVNWLHDLTKGKAYMTYVGLPA